MKILKNTGISMTKIFATALVAIILSLTGVSCSAGDNNHVKRDDWADDVKSAVNDFIDMYGSSSGSYSENSYVVSDFDNTACIFDMCE